jgi:hypothetical protein
MESELAPAIARLRLRLEEADRNANDIRRALNVLLAESGLPPEPESGGNLSSGGIAQIKDDTFYGKKQQTAIREYLEMRKVQGMGPAKPRDIFEALKSGGYQFEAKDEGIALVSLRALLRKRSHIFHRLPNGVYGLLNWYPNAKPQKVAHDHGDDDDNDDLSGQK